MIDNNDKNSFFTNVNIPKYIGNFIDLNNTHLEMLTFVKNEFLKQNNILMVNIGSNFPTQYCLHIHMLNNETYKDIYCPLEQGTKLYALLNITKIINYIKLYSLYYNNFKYNLMNVDKI